MTNIVGIAGSLRRASYNLGLLRAAALIMPDDATLQIRSIVDIPLYNADDEELTGIPFAVTSLKDAISSADGLLLATPEYNNGIPGVFKNALDWVSRPATDIPKVFGGRPVALIGTSTGGFGTVLAQDAWLSVLRTLGTQPWFGGRFVVPHAGRLFDADGNLIDDQVREKLRVFMTGFVRSIREG